MITTATLSIEEERENAIGKKKAGDGYIPSRLSLADYQVRF
jgi:hypothetical protein